MKESTGMVNKFGDEIFEGDLLFTVKSLKCGVVRKDDVSYVVRFTEKGKDNYSIFPLEDCLHLKKVGDIYSNPNGVK